MKTLVAGLGNPILSDDAAGLRVARLLQGRISDSETTVIETCIAGLDFIDALTGYDRAVIVDAMKSGGRAGQIYRFEPGSFNLTRHSNNPHDISFSNALELGRMLNMPLPREIVIYAIEVEDVTTLSVDCTPAVQQAIPRCAAMIAEELEKAKSRS